MTTNFQEKIIKKLIPAKYVLEVFEFQGHRKNTHFKNIQALTKKSYLQKKKVRLLFSSKFKKTTKADLKSLDG